MQVLEFLSKKDIEKFIDKDAYDVINYLLKKVAFSQPEVKDKSELSGIQITKEFLEDWIAQACDLKKKGAGNYPIDVYADKKYGIDVKFLTAKTNKNGEFLKTHSNETSLSQNFKLVGVSLDQMFEKKQHDEILSQWVKVLQTKLAKPVKDFQLGELFYFIFLRSGNKIYLSIAKVDYLKLKKLSVNKATATSIFVDNFIESKYGNVKIYKSKKRMELRLLPHNLQKDDKLICWDFENFYPDVISLKEIAKKGKLKKHIEEQYKKFFL